MLPGCLFTMAEEWAGKFSETIVSNDYHVTAGERSSMVALD